MNYATVDDLRASLRLTDTVDDIPLALALDSAEQVVDAYCGRSFTAGSAVRVYAPESAVVVRTDDIATVSLVETASSTDGVFDLQWSPSDWQAEPLNGRTGGLTTPVTRLRAVGSKRFTESRRATVRVTGLYGWADVPPAVRQATIIQALRLFKRLDSVLGIAGGPETGLMRVGRALDGDVAHLLDPYRRDTGAVGGIA